MIPDNTTCDMMYLVTFCFHAKGKKEIRSYLYWNGGSLRFYPEDIVNVLPALFDNNYDDNKLFTASDEVKRMTEELVIKDKYFEHFYNALAKENDDD